MPFGIGRSLKSAGRKVEKEVGRSPVAAVLTLGLTSGQLFSEAREKIYSPIKAAKKAQKEAMAQQRDMLALRVRFPAEVLSLCLGVGLALLGAAGLEVISYQFFFLDQQGFWYQLEVGLEELLEMAGVSLMLCSVTSMLERILFTTLISHFVLTLFKLCLRQVSGKCLS